MPRRALRMPATTTCAWINLCLVPLPSIPPAFIRSHLRMKHAIMGCMKHLSIKLLERYAMKEISSRDQQRVEQHVMGCPQCLDRLEGEVGWVLGMRLMDRFRRKFINPPGKSRAENE